MPVSFTEEERTNLLNVLGVGRANAISAPNLAEILGYPTTGNQVRLRKLIKECIEHDGDIIGAATGQPPGFYIITALNELDLYLDSLEGRIVRNNDRRTALINNWNNVNPDTTKTILNIE